MGLRVQGLGFRVQGRVHRAFEFGGGAGFFARGFARGGEFGDDVHELVDAVGAGVAGEEGAVAVGGEAAGGFGVVEEEAEVVFHFFAGGGDEVVFAGGEEVFGVFPG
jgi:hypothetical protein